ncbi:MAG: transposase [Mariniphaga sp.]|nr:transposase [Mariniphaga sp.]
MKKEFYRYLLPHFQQPGQAYFITWSLKDAVPKKALKRYSDEMEKLRLQIKSYGTASVMGPAGVAGAADSDPLIKKMSGSESAPPRMSDSEIAPPKMSGSAPDSYRGAPPAGAPPELKKQYYSLRKKYIKAYDELLDSDKNPKINLSKPENLQPVKETLLFWNGKKLENYAFCIMPNHIHWVFRVFEKDKKNKPVYLQDIMNSVKRFSANQINKVENRKGAVWQTESFDTTIRDEKHLHYAIEYTLNNPVAAGLVKNREDWSGNWCSGCSGLRTAD